MAPASSSIKAPAPKLSRPCLRCSWFLESRGGNVCSHVNRCATAGGRPAAAQVHTKAHPHKQAQTHRHEVCCALLRGIPQAHSLQPLAWCVKGPPCGLLAVDCTKLFARVCSEPLVPAVSGQYSAVQYGAGRGRASMQCFTQCVLHWQGGPNDNNNTNRYTIRHTQTRTPEGADAVAPRHRHKVSQTVTLLRGPVQTQGSSTPGGAVHGGR
jgi:hypothetical protein